MFHVMKRRERRGRRPVEVQSADGIQDKSNNDLLRWSSCKLQTKCGFRKKEICLKTKVWEVFRRWQPSSLHSSGERHHLPRTNVVCVLEVEEAHFSPPLQDVQEELLASVRLGSQLDLVNSTSHNTRKDPQVPGRSSRIRLGNLRSGAWRRGWNPGKK